MKTIFKYLTVFLCCFYLTSCVDNAYDLSDVDTDNVVVGETWVAPLGIGFVEAEDLVHVDKVSSVRLEADGSYMMRYEGVMRSIALRAGGSLIEVANVEVLTNDLNDLFEGEFVLDFADPRILLQIDLKSGSADLRLNLTSINGSSQESTAADFRVNKAQSNVWIGANESSVLPSYLFVRNNDLNRLIALTPKKIQMSLMADAAQVANLPSGSFNDMKFVVEAPLAPASNFKATSVEHITNAFDESFASYLFKSGTATIFGDVTNEMPFDLSVEMLILDENNQPLDISFPQQRVEGSKSGVEFVINEKDMPKMEKARHLELRLHLLGRKEAEVLKDKDRISLNLKIRKDGGIAI